MARRFQISITNVLLVFVIVGLSLGWWIDRNNVKSDVRRLRLEHAVGQSNYYRRLSAIKELGIIGNFGSIPALFYAMGDPDFQACDAASKSLTAITGHSFRGPTSIDPQRVSSLHNEEQSKALREIFQAELNAWQKWLERTHPNINPSFTPHERVAGHIDSPIHFWFPPDDLFE